MTTEQDEFNIMAEYDAQLTADLMAIQKADKAILGEVRKLLTRYKYKKLLEFLDDGGYTHSYKLVPAAEVKGDLQTEEYWFKYIYLTQYVGYCGDNFSGSMYIPITEDKFLYVWFEC